MLITTVLKEAILAGKLVLATPTVAWGVARRAFLMCHPLRQAIEDGKAHSEEGVIKRWAQLESDISHFIEGGYMTRDRLKPLDPPKYEHWELRSLRPRPSLRVFGRFAEPDVFVGTHVCERPVLGKKWSLNWELEKLTCEEHWKAAGLLDPFTADTYTAYITDNASPELGVPK